MPATEKSRALLVEALLAVAPDDLVLPDLLERIVETARELAGARYAAIGIFGPDQAISEFITRGEPDGMAEAVGHRPKGLGLLGEVMKRGDPIRLADISDDPASVGFPPGHVEMKTFLGVPIRIRDAVFGNLYLTEKVGEPEFTEEDETLLVQLARVAGAAIERASLAADHEQRRRILDAITSITAAVVEGADERALEELICRTVRSVFDADMAALALVTAGSEAAEIVVADGMGAEQLGGRALDAGSRTSLAISEGRLLTSAGNSESNPDEFLRTVGAGPVAVLPLESDARSLGAVIVARAQGQREFAESDSEFMQMFADRAALSIEHSQARRALSRLAVLEDRERIARDLHDTVIQELFATGMALQAAVPLAESADLASRINQAVDQLDEAITDLRSMIFGLESRGATSQLSESLEAIIAAERDALGFEPSLSISGPVDQASSERVKEQVRAIVRELLTNVARHAGASAASLEVVAVDDELQITVSDNGVGADAYGREGGHGVPNIIERLRELGGTLEIAAVDNGGTRADLRIPLA